MDDVFKKKCYVKISYESDGSFRTADIARNKFKIQYKGSKYLEFNCYKEAKDYITKAIYKDDVGEVVQGWAYSDETDYLTAFMKVK